jgi:outer membrane protein assembly factor BamA
MYLRLIVCCAAFLVASVPLLVGAETENSPSGRIRIRYAGVDDTTRRRLVRAARRELDAFRSDEGRPADLADAAYAMQRWLESQGYARADVSFRMLDGDGDPVLRVDRFGSVRTVEFLVEEGTRLRVAGIRFPGAEQYAEAYLASFFAFGPQGPFAPEQPVFRRSDVLGGIARVEQLYLLNGYHRVSVGPHRLEGSDGDGTDAAADPSTVTVVVPIREGRQYRLRDVAMEAPSLEGSERRQLRTGLPEEGAAYHPRLVAEGAARLRDRLGRLGYRGTVQARTHVDDENARVDVLYEVSSGPRLVFHRLEVRGPEQLATSRRLVSAQFPLRPGDLITASKLDAGVSRLYDLGIFSTVRVEVVPAQEAPTIDGGRPSVVVVHVTERKNRFLEIAVGWGSYDMLTGALSYTDLNVLGVAREWRSRLDGSVRGASVRTSVTDRILLAPSGSVSVGGSYQYRQEPAFLRSEADAQLGITYEPTETLELAAFYDFSRSFVPAGEAGGAAPISTGSLTLDGALDTRDSAITPTSGYRVAASVGLAAPFIGSQLRFLELSVSAVGHLPFDEAAVLSARLAYATKLPLAGEESLPIQQRLFAGGANSVRAYPQDALGPVGDDQRPRGGLTRWIASAELRIRLYRMLQGAVFYDAGSVSAKPVSLLGSIGHGPGIGLRYRLPVGPARLDVAYNPGPRYAAPRSWAWHVAVGLSF